MTVAGEVAGVGSRARLVRTVVAVTAAGVVAFAELYGVQALLPALGHDLDLHPADAALIQSAAALGLAVAVLPWAFAARRFGRGPMLRIALVGTVLLGPVVAVLGSFELLVAARFLLGVVVAGIPALALSHVGEILDRGGALVAAGWYVGGTAIGGLTGRLVAGTVGALLDWRAGLVAVSLLTVMAVVVFLVLIPRPSGTAAVPLASRVLLRDRRIHLLCAIALLLMGSFVALYNFLGFHLTGPVFRLPDIVVSLVFVLYLLGSLSAATVGRVAARWGRARVLIGAIVIQLTGTALAATPHLVVELGGVALATAGFFAAHGLAAGWVAEVGAGSALPSALYTLAYYLGAGGIGWSVGFVYAGASWSATVGTMSGLVGLAAFAALLLSRPPTKEEAT